MLAAQAPEAPTAAGQYGTRAKRRTLDAWMSPDGDPS